MAISFIPQLAQIPGLQAALDAKVAAASPALTGAVTIAGGTVTTDVKALDISQTWNNAGFLFTALKLNVTKIAASNENSKLLDIKVNGSSAFEVIEYGGGGKIRLSGSTNAEIYFSGSNILINAPWAVGHLVIGDPSTRLYQDSDGSLALRNGTAAQTLRVYGTFTSATNYARASLSSSATGCTLSAQTAGGTGNADLFLSPMGTGVVQINNGTAGTLGDLKLRTLKQTEHMEIESIGSAPSLPVSGRARLWVQPDAYGKLQLKIGFPTGSPYTIAIEP